MTMDDDWNGEIGDGHYQDEIRTLTSDLAEARAEVESLRRQLDGAMAVGDGQAGLIGKAIARAESAEADATRARESAHATMAKLREVTDDLDKAEAEVGRWKTQFGIEVQAAIDRAESAEAALLAMNRELKILPEGERITFVAICQKLFEAEAEVERLREGLSRINGVASNRNTSYHQHVLREMLREVGHEARALLESSLAGCNVHIAGDTPPQPESE
jgi:chromosome segregation ATPase